MSWGTVTTRTAWIFVGAFAFFEAVSTFVFLAAADFSPATLSDPTRLVAIGERGADLLRVAALLDMFGYLSAVPLAIYLGGRFRGQNAIDLFTLAGILLLLMGSLGALTLAFAGAPLIHQYATASAAGKEAVGTVFDTVYRFVFFGIWQTLDGLLGAVWLFGTGRLAWMQRAKPLAVVLLLAGLFGIGFAIAHIAGVYS